MQSKPFTPYFFNNDFSIILPSMKVLLKSIFVLDLLDKIQYAFSQSEYVLHGLSIDNFVQRVSF